MRELIQSICESSIQEALPILCQDFKVSTESGLNPPFQASACLSAQFKKSMQGMPGRFRGLTKP